ncbi:hypothetical protein GCM10027614_21330 [Micromonospora vulcania]
MRRGRHLGGRRCQPGRHGGGRLGRSTGLSAQPLSRRCGWSRPLARRLRRLAVDPWPEWWIDPRSNLARWLTFGALGRRLALGALAWRLVLGVLVLGVLAWRSTFGVLARWLALGALAWRNGR